jgi:hypothetical protein
MMTLEIRICLNRSTSSIQRHIQNRGERVHVVLAPFGKCHTPVWRCDPSLSLLVWRDSGRRCRQHVVAHATLTPTVGGLAVIASRVADETEGQRRTWLGSTPTFDITMNSSVVLSRVSQQYLGCPSLNADLSIGIIGLSNADMRTQTQQRKTL